MSGVSKPTGDLQAQMYDKLVDVESLMDELVHQHKRTNKALNRVVALQRRIERATQTLTKRKKSAS